jgi:predicted transcriptional regulator YdeE
MPVINQEYLEYLNAPDFEPPRLVRLDDMILAGLMAPLTADPETLSSLWRNLRGTLRELPITPGPREFWGIRFPPQMPEGSSFYLAAVQIPAFDAAPSGFVTKIIPAGDYVCLVQPKATADLDLGLAYLCHTFLPKSGIYFLDPLEIERFGERREILIPIRGSQ